MKFVRKNGFVIAIICLWIFGYYFTKGTVNFFGLDDESFGGTWFLPYIIGAHIGIFHQVLVRMEQIDKEKKESCLT